MNSCPRNAFPVGTRREVRPIVLFGPTWPSRADQSHLSVQIGRDQELQNMVCGADTWRNPIVSIVVHGLDSWQNLFRISGAIPQKGVQNATPVFRRNTSKRDAPSEHPCFAAQYLKVIRTCGANDFARSFGPERSFENSSALRLRTSATPPRCAPPRRSWGGVGDTLGGAAPFADSIGAIEVAELLSRKWPGEPAR